ncbi:glycoside hydrolase family 5 protein [Penicillium chermesinum]|nr:glycoside hydrolase family 5 protein [Penicillium chermesinum]
MRLFPTLVACLVSLAGAPRVFAAKSFAGSNLYYAAGLSSDEQETLFSGLQDAGAKVLRVWLDAEDSPQKNTTFTSYPPLESDKPGSWDDTVLNNLDDVMFNANKYGIKLLISIHSYNALAGKNDFYGQWYGTGDFYTDKNAIQYFKNRIAHVLAHADPDALTAWQCTMGQAIKDNLNGNTGILVTTGGGAYLANSLLDAYFSCKALDMLAIHAYGTSDFATDQLPAIQWGACYFDSENNSCQQSQPLSSDTRDNNIKKWADSISAAGIPWLYWQILPNEDPHEGWDYEVGINGVNWDALKAAASSTSSYDAAFDFSGFLL